MSITGYIVSCHTSPRPAAICGNLCVKRQARSITVKLSRVCLLHKKIKQGKIHPRTRREGTEGEQKAYLCSFCNLGARGGWVAKARPRPLCLQERDPLPFVEEAGWGTGPGWTGAKNLSPIGIRYPHRPAPRKSPFQPTRK